MMVFGLSEENADLNSKIKALFGEIELGLIHLTRAGQSKSFSETVKHCTGF